MLLSHAFEKNPSGTFQAMIFQAPLSDFRSEGGGGAMILPDDVARFRKIGRDNTAL